MSREPKYALIRCVATALFAISIGSARADESWHLFTQTYGGTVSLLHGLDNHTCEFAKNRALGRPATDEEKSTADRRAIENLQAAQKACDGTTGDVYRNNVSCQDGKARSWPSGIGGGGIINAGDIRRAECFQ